MGLPNFPGHGANFSGKSASAAFRNTKHGPFTKLSLRLPKGRRFRAQAPHPSSVGDELPAGLAMPPGIGGGPGVVGAMRTRPRWAAVLRYRPGTAFDLLMVDATSTGTEAFGEVVREVGG